MMNDAPSWSAAAMLPFAVAAMPRLCTAAWPRCIRAAAWPPHSLLAPDLLEARVAAASVPVKGVPDRIFRVVVLVVFLGGPEAARGDDVGHHALIGEALLHGFFRGERGAVLHFIVIVDRAFVLLALVAELAVSIEWIDVVPENIEQLLVRDLRRVVRHLHRLA